MISLPVGTRIWIAAGVIDMRWYREVADCARLVHRYSGFVGASSDDTAHNELLLRRSQQLDQSTGRPEAAPAGIWNSRRGERFQLLSRLGTKINFDALNLGVTEPERNPLDIVCRL